MDAANATLRRRARAVGDLILGHLPQSQDRRVRDAGQYWSGDDDSLPANSHWRTNAAFSEEVWSRVGTTHLTLVEDFVRHEGRVEFPRRVLEWGCGGGANAVVFAPRAQEYIGADVSVDSLTECARQVLTAGAAPMTAVLIDIARPEAAVEKVGEVDLFLCTYVVELLPSQEYAARLLSIAHEVLAPGGLAMIQVKYQTSDRSTRSWRGGYSKHLASMTTFPIEEFWQLCIEAGLPPQYVRLVPRTDLDTNYAYYFLMR